MNSKTYLLLIFLAFANVTQLWHGLTHKHTFCLKHDQFEETENTDKQDAAHKTKLSKAAFTAQSTEEKEHQICEYISSFRKANLSSPTSYATYLNTDIFVNPYLKLSHKTDNLSQAPKASPPQPALS